MKKAAQAIGGGIGLLMLRAALPVLLTWLANRSLRKVPGYRGSVQRIRLDFTAPRVMVQVETTKPMLIIGSVKTKDHLQR